MFDDDLFNYYTGTTTETEQSTGNSSTTEEQNPYSATTNYNPYQTPSYDTDYNDDYSVTPNYNEEKTYQSNPSTSISETEESQEVKRYRKMNMPVIERSEQAVSLTKTRQRVQLQPRMKIAITMFAVIMFSLVFAIIWNFASVSKYNSMIANKQTIVNELSSSITGLNNEYTLLGDEEQLRELAKNAGFVESDESNTYYASAGEFYTEQTVEELPSNWFNDVCEFFSNLFR